MRQILLDRTLVAGEEMNPAYQGIDSSCNRNVSDITAILAGEWAAQLTP